MENSKIEWTDHTFNPWHGCMKVSAGCKNCYAETLDNRWKGGHWGPGSTRKAMSDTYWRQPLKWNAAAEKEGKMAKVFCASMADVFEGHQDTLPHLKRLFILIENTPHLIWQLLTKRPQNILPLLPQRWDGKLPDNVWIGTSVEDQAAADTRIPNLLQVPAKVRFLSMEPLLGPVDLSVVRQTVEPGFFGDCLQWYHRGKYSEDRGTEYSSISWVIVGGESGHHARPMHPDWVRSLRDQCATAGVPFFFKQWGEYLPFCQLGPDPENKNAINPGFPVRTFPSPHNTEKLNKYFKCGKGWAGSLLDCTDYKAFPLTAEEANKRLQA